MRFFQFVEVEHGIAPRKDFDDLRSQEVHLVHGMVANQQAGLCTVFQHDEHATVHQQGYVAAQDVDELNGLLHHYVLGHINKQAVLCKSGVEGSDAVLRCIGQGTEVFRYEVSVVAKTTDDDAIGQCFLRGMKGIVHHEIKRCAHIGHVALEYFVGIDRESQPLEVHAIVRLEAFGNVGVFVGLLPTGGKTQTLEIGESTGTQIVERGSAVSAQQGFRLGV